MTKNIGNAIVIVLTSQNNTENYETISWNFRFSQKLSLSEIGLTLSRKIGSPFSRAGKACRPLTRHLVRQIGLASLAVLYGVAGMWRNKGPVRPAGLAPCLSPRHRGAATLLLHFTPNTFSTVPSTSRLCCTAGNDPDSSVSLTSKKFPAMYQP